jgi:hypothetical protein
LGAQLPSNINTRRKEKILFKMDGFISLLLMVTDPDIMLDQNLCIYRIISSKEMPEQG